MEDLVPSKLPNTIADFLKSEIVLRKNKNAQYTLRSFARDCGLSSGHLSEIINDGISITQKTAEKIATSLKLKAEDEKFFLSLSQGKNNEFYNYDSNYLTIADDYYKVLTEWHYFALVELIPLDCFQYDYEWIARRLGISMTDARQAIERLKKVKLLSEENGKLYQTYDYFVSPSGTPLDAAKKFHRQILEKAIKAVFSQEIEKRDFTSGFLRCRSSDLPLISSKIKQFRRELAREVESGEGHDSVYAFSIQFFRGDCSDVDLI